jgi:putative transposase
MIFRLSEMRYNKIRSQPPPFSAKASTNGLFIALLRAMKAGGTGPELHTFKAVPKRWIVERTFGWFNWYRRLSKDYEHNLKTSEAMLHFTSCTLMLRWLVTL